MKRFISVAVALLMALTALPVFAGAEGAGDALGSLVYTGSMELEYASQFSVDYYEGGYQLITVSDGARVLTVPEGAAVPEGLPEDVMVLAQPVSDLMVSSTPITSLINALGRLSDIKYTTTDADGWYIEDVKSAVESGALTYIGTYKEPDFEVLAADAPSFGVFSTMLDNVPDVAEKLTELGILYMRDYSTFENHPLGRVEWIKLYGVLLGADDEAQAVYDAQKQLVDSLSNAETGKTCAIFYITSKGTLHVRNGSDYIARMMELAGGEYILSDFNPEGTGAEEMGLEDFYARASEADYILYLGSMGGKPQTIEEMVARWDLLSEFKAVREGNVYSTTPDFFQVSDTLGNIIVDMNRMLTGDDAELTYLFELQ